MYRAIQQKYNNYFSYGSLENQVYDVVTIIIIHRNKFFLLNVEQQQKYITSAQEVIVY